MAKDATDAATPGGMHKATWRGRTIAASDRTLEVDGYRYFPRDAVRMEMLEAVERTARDLECPHGVRFYDVVGDGTRSARAAWSYEAPQTRMKPIDHWIGFWEDVDVA